MPTPCPHCNMSIDANTAACPHCGEALLAPASPTTIPVVDPGIVLPFGEFQHAVLYRGMFRAERLSRVINLISGILYVLGGGSNIYVNYLYMNSPDRQEWYVIFMFCFGTFMFIYGILFLMNSISAFFPKASRLLLFNRHLNFSALLQQYSSLLAKPPSPDMQAKANALLDRLQNARAGESSDIVEFTAVAENQFVSSLWRGILQPGMIIFGLFTRSFRIEELVNIQFVSPAEVEIKNNVGSLSKYLERYSLSINGQDYNAWISPDNYQRLLAWKESEQPSSVE